ncbi:aldehyde dehydrogenase family protein [Cryptosporangium sp. NPDC051539]|uniref:aldehyde dehydrogenase family protein n=1 Tax=Cryptosporangium sp. NPDC051539 TaxID=3363962 RepID=UPI0037B1E8BC
MSDLTISTLIDGESAPGTGAEEIEVLNPSTGRPIASFRESGADQVDAAVAAARAAARGWGRTTPGRRSEALTALADLVATHFDEIAALESVDAGKPITAARTVEMPGIVNGLRFFAGAGRASAALAAGEYVEGNTVMMRREPVGVVAAITPWNFPLQQAVWKIAPALATGNTVVIKPAENTPLSTARFVQLANEILPPGVLNVVHGRGPTTGEALASHRDVDLVSFTGSTRAGARIASLAGSNLKPVVLELGGNAPVIVFDDADLDVLIPKLVVATLFNAGQECMSGNRILVDPALHDQLVERLAAGMAAWVPGDASDEKTQLGPLISEAHRTRVRKAVEGRSASTELVIGGDAPDRPGFYFNPTLVTGVAQDDPLVQEEVFGPVATVQTFGSEEDALRLANDTAYGLAASAWTRDAGRAMRAGRELNFGSVWINDYFVLGPEIAQGGFGASGFGKEGGLPGLDELTRLKQVSISLI